MGMEFFQPLGARRRKASLSGGIGLYLLLRHLPRARAMLEQTVDFETIFGVVAALVGLYGLAYAAYLFLAAPKPVLTISEEYIRGKRLFGGPHEIDAGSIERIVGGGDNLRVQMTSGRYESLSMAQLSEEDRAEVVESAKRLIRDRSQDG